MLIKSLIVFPLLILGLSASAASPIKDKSYIVTKTNDTLYGRLKVNYLIGGIKLITADSSYRLDPNTYVAYYNAKDNTLYRSKVLPGFIPKDLAKKMAIPEKASWLKCIEDGKIKLYEYKSYTFGKQMDNVLDVTSAISSIVVTGGIPNSEYTSWFIEKDSSQLASIKYNNVVSAGSKTRKERKELLKDMLADNDIVSQNYSQIRSFTFKAIEKLVHAYNNSKS